MNEITLQMQGDFSFLQEFLHPGLTFFSIVI